MTGGKKKGPADIQKEVQAQETKYSKEHILNSEQYQSRIDLLAALLEDGKQYSCLEVDRKISEFMKGKVK